MGQALKLFTVFTSTEQPQRIRGKGVCGGGGSKSIDGNYSPLSNTLEYNRMRCNTI